MSCSRWMLYSAILINEREANEGHNQTHGWASCSSSSSHHCCRREIVRRDTPLCMQHEAWNLTKALLRSPATANCKDRPTDQADELWSPRRRTECQHVNWQGTVVSKRTAALARRRQGARCAEPMSQFPLFSKLLCWPSLLQCADPATQSKLRNTKPPPLQ